MACCPETALPGLQEEYEPKGTIVAMGKGYVEGKELTGYVVGDDEKAEAAIVIAYDVFGLEGGRTRAIADQLALEGYYVVVADLYYEKDHIDLHGGIIETYFKICREIEAVAIDLQINFDFSKFSKLFDV